MNYGKPLLSLGAPSVPEASPAPKSGIESLTEISRPLQKMCSSWMPLGFAPALLVILSIPSVAQPTISSVAAINLTTNSATITWSTDQPATAQVNYGTTAAYGELSPVTTALVTSQAVTLTGLTPNTTYNYQVISANAASRISTSTNYQFATPSLSAQPPTLGYVAFWGITDNSVIISWSTDLNANTVVAYDTSPKLSQIYTDVDPGETSTANHGVVLTGLLPGTTYYFVAQSTAQSGATGYSAMFSFTTTGTPSTTPSFTLSATSVTALVGSTGKSTITVAPTNGFNSAVTLAASGWPSGITGTVGTNPTSTSSSVTINVDRSVAPGSYSLTLKGTSGTLSVSTAISLIASGQNSFALSATPATANVGSTGNYMAYGDSITYGAGASSLATDYASLIGADVSSTLTNRGVKSSQACDATQVIMANDNPPESLAPLQTIMIGINDAYYQGVGTYESVYKSCHTAALAWLVIPSTQKTLAQSCTQTGTWTPDSTYLSGVALKSSTNGSVLSCPVTSYGGPLYLWYRVTDSNAGVFSYAIDDGQSTQVDSFSSPPIHTAQGGVDGVFMIRVAGLAAGPHTIRVTVTSPTSSSNVVSILAAGSLNTSAKYGAPQLFVGGVIRLKYDAFPAASAAYDADAAADVALLSGDGAPVYFAPVRDYVDSFSNMYDGFHPNDSGHIELRNAFEAVPQFSVYTSGSVTSIVTVTPANGFNSDVTLAASGWPAGITATFGANPVTLSSIVTIQVGAGVAPGLYLLAVNGTSGSLSVSTTIPLSVNAGATSGLVPQTITFGPISVQTAGAPVTLSATTGSGLAVSFASTTTSVCTVSGRTAILLAGGTCSITASQTGNATYTAATPVTQSFTVLSSQTITFGRIATQIIGTSVTLTATSDSGLPVSYASMNPAVCTVSGNTATFLSSGSCSITASQAGNATYAMATTVTESFLVGTPNAPQMGFVVSWGSITALSVSWSTDVPATTQLAYGTTSALGILSPPQTALTISHGVDLTGLTPGTKYYFVAQSIGANGVTGYSTVGSFTTYGTAPSNPAPAISGVSAGSITNTSAVIAWTTDQASSSQVNYGGTTAYGSSSTLNTSLVTGHTIALTGLTPGTSYDFDVISTNATSQSTTSGNFTFTTTGSAPPPAISNITTNSLTSSSVTITWTTDQAATDQVNYGTTTAFGSSSTVNTSLVTSHSVTLAGLAPGTTYDFDVVSANGTNVSATSANATFTTLVVTGPAPNVGYVAAWGINNTGATVTWSTDVLATTQMAYGTTASLGQLSPLQTTLAASHGVILSGLNPGTTYYFVAQSTGSNGVTGYSSVISFTTTGTAPTNPAPVISGVTPSSITGTSAVILWNTDQASSSQVNYGGTTAYGQSSTLNASLVISHSIVLTDLVPGTTYNFDVVATNATNQSSISGNFTFTTTGSAPPPVITNITTNNLTGNSVTIMWTTDQASASLVNYGTSTAYGSSTSNTSLVTTHSVTLMGLTPGTTYDFDVVSANASNVSATSVNSTFTTPTATGPAPNVGYLAFWGINSTGITISWSTDVPATTQLAYGTTTAMGSLTPVQNTLTASHGVILTGLNPGTTYYFEAQSTSASGVTGSSTLYSFTTNGSP